MPFQEAGYNSSQFHNNAERQEEVQHKSVNAGGGARRSQLPMTPEEHSQQLQQSVRFRGDHRRSERYSYEGLLGHDMWRQLQRVVAIPIFSGDKRKYVNWKAVFLACIDRAPATPEYKLLQLRQYLAGVALEATKNLGFSGAAYEAAKDRLKRKSGGQRREITIHLDLDNFEPLTDGCSKDIEKFADLLDILVVNMLGRGRHDELGNGFLYIKLSTEETSRNTAYPPIAAIDGSSRIEEENALKH